MRRAILDANKSPFNAVLAKCMTFGSMPIGYYSNVAMRLTARSADSADTHCTAGFPADACRVTVSE